MKKRATIWIQALALILCIAANAAEIPAALLKENSPLVTFRILFTTGAAYDPPGREGVASLTAALMTKGGTKNLTYEQIVAALYPMASSIDWQVDKEMTVFSGATHLDNLDAFYALLRQMLVEPGFREDDFARLKTDAINFLKVSLREGNDEELAKEHLYNVIFAGHPYGHHNMGTLQSLEKLTLADCRTFYQQHLTRANLVIGLAGGFPDALPDKIKKDLSVLAPGRAENHLFKPVKLAKGWDVQIIQRETRATAISLGFPIQLKRGDRDWAALALASSYLGEHRSSVGRLYQRLRESRGLNYGDYTYIEYFPRGMFQFAPDANLGRHEQLFQLWIRPVEPKNAVFALRCAIFELNRLVEKGMTQEEFESTRDYLSKYVNILIETQDARLGYALDSKFYDIPDFPAYLRKEFASLTLDDVNRVIRRHLKTDPMRIAIVTKDATALREALAINGASPMQYNSPKPKDIMQEDEIISNLRLPVTPGRIQVLPLDQIFK